MSSTSLRIVCALGAAIGLFAATAASAKPEYAGAASGDRFAIMDADKNNVVTKEEFFAAYPQMKEAAFASIDADGDGSITTEEWAKFMSGHGKGAGMANNPKLVTGQTAPVSAGAPEGAAQTDAAQKDTAPAQAAPKSEGQKAAPELIMPPSDAKK